MSNINTAFLQLPQRAEKYDRDYLVSTFVDVGGLFTLLSTRDNHILYGRRGTGKSHILYYLASSVENKGNIPVLIDMRMLGSSGGIYSDSNISLSDRATRLLIDTFTEIHSQLLQYILRSENVDQSILVPLMDQLIDNITEVTVIGTIEKEETASAGISCEDNFTFNIGGEGKGITSGLGFTQKDKLDLTSGEKYKRAGVEKHRIHFGSVQKTLTEIMGALNKQTVWVLLDEWSEIPLDLQPYLADLLRRTLFPVRGMIVKIAALEQRANFRISSEGAGYIGIEVGADVSTSLNLDEHMVFDNDAEKAKDFFEKLVYKHTIPVFDAEGLDDKPRDSGELIRQAFTQRNVFEEFVKAAEGVPRDAINILSLGALAAGQEAISMSHIRNAAKRWYNRAKENAIASKPEAQRLLRWIVDEVIKHRKARAFLLRNDARHELIDFLYDARIIHVVKQNISSHDLPGIRFNV